jgi:ABC-type transporter Mla MlaB component
MQWEPSALPTPSVVELAAFDFAESRDSAVESHLLTSLQTEADFQIAEQIFQALLDFYWATGQEEKLQSRSLDYVQRYGRVPEQRPDVGEVRIGRAQSAGFIAAEHFDALQLRAFEQFVNTSSTHLMLDWSELIAIPEPQREPMAKALEKLNDRRVMLELHGVDMLLAVTRLQSRPAASSPDAALRLQVLRLARDEVGFVDLAVELAVDGSRSPVDWIAPSFQLVASEGQGLTTQHGAQRQTQDADQTRRGDEGLFQTTVRLGGNLSGSGVSFLRALREQSRRADLIIVELHAVQRMDFPAATDLLNWVEAQSHLGKTIELRGAHSLLRTFLESVGLQIHR